MKTAKFGLAFLGVAGLLLLAGGAPQAFHSGGVAECAGCHSMHFPKAGGSFLLVGVDASSTCLTCHQSATDTAPNGYHVSTIDSKLGPGLAPLQRGPAGDFGWVKKDYITSATSEDGATHGHNIVATDFNYVVDPTNSVAPGGNVFPSSQLGCTSCHDPHGRARRLSDGSFVNAVYSPGSTNAYIIGSGSYDNSAIPAAGEAVGVYRLLRGLGDNTQGVTFNGVAVAVAPSTYNRTEAVTQTRVAYGASGANSWGNWCATCHPGMHSSGNYVHPVDQSLGQIATAYNAYVKSGDLTGTSASAYSSLVPFAENTGVFTTLASHAKNNDTFKFGPSSSDQVMCLSCHRAHASGMMYGLRFDIEYEFMVKAGMYIGSDNPAITGSRAPNQHRGRTVAEWQAAYYDRPATQFAAYQRVLCNKCHAKD